MFSSISLFKFSMIFHVLNSSAQCDRPESWQLAFQDPASPILEGIINLHHDVMTILLFILGAVSIVMGSAIYFFNAKRYNPKVYYTGLTHHANVEFSWTLVPCLILLVIAVPSFALIYSLDDLISARMTIKVMGHQWYWTYEYGEIAEDNTLLLNPLTQTPKAFDSYMVPESSLNKDGTNSLELRVLRLLEVDNRLIIPWNEHVRFLISSADVLHSWSIPSLGVKMDACPGRLNQVSLFLNRPGVFYGQCSEICGVNHSFMPICVETP
jgi:cytochrome c oxidase subunit 2